MCDDVTVEIRFLSWVGSCFFQAEDGIRDLVRSRGLGDVYKRQEEGDYGEDVVTRDRVDAAADYFLSFRTGRTFTTLSLIHI